MISPETPAPTLSLVIPVYNEEAVLAELDRRLQSFLAELALDVEVIFVNDGSSDSSLEILRHLATTDSRYSVLSLSRNFGQPAASSAGLDCARGRAVVVMDADLQDPPEVVLEMIARWRDGFDVVYARRRRRFGESVFKRVTALLFYRLFARMIPIAVPLDTGDFRLMSQRVVAVLRALPESHRFLRGLVAWAGFRQGAVEYDRPERFAGETKYPVRSMVSYALDGITSFSVLPLRFASYLGILTSLGAVALVVWAVTGKLMGVTVPGWATTVGIVSLLAAVQLLMIGILGEYVGRIYEQVKQRPLYVIAERVGGRWAETADVRGSPGAAAPGPTAPRVGNREGAAGGSRRPGPQNDAID
jgi:dolichol-phosphate mannosyltransferase